MATNPAGDGSSEWHQDSAIELNDEGRSPSGKDEGEGEGEGEEVCSLTICRLPRGNLRASRDGRCKIYDAGAVKFYGGSYLVTTSCHANHAGHQDGDPCWLLSMSSPSGPFSCCSLDEETDSFQALEQQYPYVSLKVKANAHDN